jgi:hypothetical protein
LDDGCTRSDSRAPPGAGPEFEFAANQMDSFTHADETEPRREAGTINVEANSVIGYFQADI